MNVFNRKQAERNPSYELSQLEECLLILLSVEPPSKQATGMYGLAFTDAIEKASQGERKISYGSLYPALHRMENKDLISFKWGDEDKGPRRKYYMITPKGRDTLHRLQEFRAKLTPIALQIYGSPAALESAAEIEIPIVPTEIS